MIHKSCSCQIPMQCLIMKLLMYWGNTFGARITSFLSWLSCHILSNKPGEHAHLMQTLRSVAPYEVPHHLEGIPGSINQNCSGVVGKMLRNCKRDSMRLCEREGRDGSSGAGEAIALRFSTRLKVIPLRFCLWLKLIRLVSLGVNGRIGGFSPVYQCLSIHKPVLRALSHFGVCKKKVRWLLYLIFNINCVNIEKSL